MIRHRAERLSRSVRPAEVTTLLAFQWGVSSLFGWGVYGLNLALHGQAEGRAITTLCHFDPARLGIDKARQWALRDFFATSQRVVAQLRVPGIVQAPDGLVLHALGNNLCYAATGANDAIVMGRRTIGVTFFEQVRLDAAALEKGRSYERLIAGSTWNAEKLRENGLDRVSVVLQGIDPTLFHPAPKAGLFRGRFAIFSGGKLEFRKGQDIVLRAFRMFRQRHPEALLVTAWHSPWEANLSRTMGALPGLAPVPLTAQNQLDISGWAQANGIPGDSVLDLGAMPNSMMPQVLREMDVALFPNRSEGGTNLVAMEAMACGLPVVLSDNTGHRDLIGPGNCYVLRKQGTIPREECREWGDSDPEELVERLEEIFNDTTEAARRGQAAAESLSRLTWRHSIANLLREIG